MRKWYGLTALAVVASAVVSVAWMDYRHRHPESPLWRWLGLQPAQAAQAVKQHHKALYPLGSSLAAMQEPSIFPLEDMPHLISELRQLSGLKSEAVPDALEVVTARYEEQEEPVFLAKYQQKNHTRFAMGDDAACCPSCARPNQGHFVPQLPVILAIMEDIRGDVLFHLTQPVSLEDTLTLPRENISAPKVIFAGAESKRTLQAANSCSCDSECPIASALPKWAQSCCKSLDGFFSYFPQGEVHIEVKIDPSTPLQKPSGQLSIGFKVDAKKPKDNKVSQVNSQGACTVTCTSQCTASGSCCSQSKSCGSCPHSSTNGSPTSVTKADGCCVTSCSPTPLNGMTVRFYSVAGLVNEQCTERDLIECLCRMVAPLTWDVEAKDPPCVVYFPPGRCLIVRQSAAVHAEVDCFFKQMHAMVEGVALKRTMPAAVVMQPQVIDLRLLQPLPESHLVMNVGELTSVGACWMPASTCATTWVIDATCAPCPGNPNCNSPMVHCVFVGQPVACCLANASALGAVPDSACCSLWTWSTHFDGISSLGSPACTIVNEPCGTWPCMNAANGVIQTSQCGTDSWKRAALRTYWIYQNDPRSSQVVPAHVPAQAHPSREGDD